MIDAFKRHRVKDDLGPRLYVLCDVASSWIQRRNGDRSLRLRTQMLRLLLAQKYHPSVVFTLTLLSSVTVHVGLQRARASEPLVANLAFVLLLRAG